MVTSPINSDLLCPAGKACSSLMPIKSRIKNKKLKKLSAKCVCDVTTSTPTFVGGNDKITVADVHKRNKHATTGKVIKDDFSNYINPLIECRFVIQIFVFKSFCFKFV